MTTADPAPLIVALRHSQDRLAAAVRSLGSAGLHAPTACAEWDVAQVLSHLGSQAEIFDGMLEAGLTGGSLDTGGFPAVWDRWNARSPEAQVADSLATNDALVARLEALDADALDGFALEAFGLQLDAAAFVRLRLFEHVLHTWDVEVGARPDVTVPTEAAELLVDALGQTVARLGRASTRHGVVRVDTTAPVRHLALVTDGVALEQRDVPHPDAVLALPAEALVRLAYGRVGADDPTVTFESDRWRFEDLLAIFPGP